MNDLHEYNTPHNITQIEQADLQLLNTKRHFNNTNRPWPNIGPGIFHRAYLVNTSTYFTKSLANQRSPTPAPLLSGIACRIKNKPWLASFA